MVQFVDKSEDELKFWRIFTETLEQTKLDIKAFYDTAYQSKLLGTVLYEEKLMPIYKVLEKRAFIKAYSAIVEGEKTFGSINSYLKLLLHFFDVGNDKYNNQNKTHYQKQTTFHQKF